MHSSFGNNFRVTVFGESHGVGIGVVIDGLPAGEAIDFEELGRFMVRRAPGQRGTTPRKEKDIPEVLSGYVDGRTTGSAMTLIIRNKDQRSEDYVLDIPRPSHADLNVHYKFNGYMDMRGSGPFSGRLTAPLCLAGGIAKQILARRGITVGAHLAQIKDILDDTWDLVNVTPEELKSIGAKGFPTISEDAADRMLTYLEALKDEGDSVGGRIHCMAHGVPQGLGEPNYMSFESHLAHMLFSVPGMRGVSFGRGFAAVGMNGSEHNDPIVPTDGGYKTATNNAGGIVGGITNGMPISFDVAMKPAASIGKSQTSISLSKGEPAVLNVVGRHDPSIAVRAVPVIESALAIVIMDFMEGYYGLGRIEK